ncbi:Transposase [Shigella dysenteriae 1617]|uniref:Transposase n=1 Tax=Shigella dysenteriae 1617 TaxID=754093 RepID=A0A0A6ZXY4_SHIDY|nr:Transposase [Shigella dysenteriae 1617]
MAVTAAKSVMAFRVLTMAVDLCRLTTRTMNVNAGHERTSKARIIHQIQLIRGITTNFNCRKCAFHCFTDGVEERGDEAGITRFHRHCAGTFGKRNGIITHYLCNMRHGSQFLSACELALQTSGSRLEYSYFSTCTNIRLTPD